MSMYRNDYSNDYVYELRDRNAKLLEFIRKQGHGMDCNYYMQFHDESGYICDCGLEELMGVRYDPMNPKNDGRPL